MKVNYDAIIGGLTIALIIAGMVALYFIAGRAMDYQIEQNNRYMMEVRDGRLYR